MHGDPEARAALGARLREFTVVRFPEDGEDAELADAPPRRAVSLVAEEGVGRGQPFQAQTAWERLGDGSGVQLTLAELARAWVGRSSGEDEHAILRAALTGDQRWFQPVPELEDSFRLVAPRELRPEGRERRRGAVRVDSREEPKGIDQQAILAAVERHLGGASDLYRRGIDPETGGVTLYFFHFPDQARELHADAIDALRKEAGVEVTLNPYPHQGELERLARELTPAGLMVLKDA